MAVSKVLMVAEKPSIALSIATALSHGQMSTRKGSTEVHEFEGRFLGAPARFKVTSVIGHVFSVDFHGKYQDWATTDPLDLFQAQVIKTESNPKAHICKHLKQEARGCHYLVLWLDCDREGENICFEVIESTGFKINDVYRARFSSVTERDVLNALANLVRPNRDEAMAVDARQEIDLKVGVAFTRFQTSFFQGKYGNLDARVISYGPCQTPTLGFCVQRYLQINTFKPEKFWSLQPYIIQSGYEILLEWQRSKLFDINVAMMFQKLVAEDGILEVTDISEKQETKGRPVGLNTVNLLKVASSALGFGPQTAMQLAERLYTQGFISYPRTESTAYPPSFDFRGALSAQRNNPTWGNYVEGLLTSGYQKPRSGTDVGDHPPITPMKSASEDMLGNDAWKLYQYICQYFIGTVSPDCKYVRKKVEFSVGGESFHCTGQHVITKGFTAIMPWLAINDKSIPSFTKGQKIKVSKVELYEGNTTPPDFLTESELISLMEKNGIGTDASIPVHINNICERNYVQVQAGRKLVPTTLGITLVRGYQSIDPDLCLPDIRSFIEQQITLIAKGQVDHHRVVQHVIEQFKQKFCYFVKKIEAMDALFEAQFSALVDSGRIMSKCGKCLRYMKYISSQPPRLYCGTCEEVYYLPQKGTIKDVSRFRTRVHEFIQMDEMIEPYVEFAGFGHVSKIQSWSVDAKFVLALQERWRPETHTFWFPTGECTVTLEDVYMLVGLPIEGKAVNGKTNYANTICEELLGADLLDDNPRGQGILLSRLKNYYHSLVLNENSTEEEYIIKTRCYIMLLIGCFLFPEGTGSTMHVMYLNLLRNVDRISGYSWGSACLAYLYSSLCKNARKDASTFSACAVLLQAWGWSRLPSLAPVNRNPFTFPYATKWSARGMSYNRCPRNCIEQYRSLLDHLRPEDFIWRPYLNLDDDHEINQADATVWTACTPIIRFTTVEMHNSDRVKLQFGMQQNIPDPPRDISQWHLKRVCDQWNYNPWQAFAKTECRVWKHRLEHVLTDAIMPTEQKPTRNYMAWYRSVGFHFIAPDMYLHDPRQMDYTQHPSTSHAPQNFQTTYPQPPTQQSFRTPNMPYTQPQHREQTPYQSQSEYHQQHLQSSYPVPHTQHTPRSYMSAPSPFHSQQTQTSPNQDITQPYAFQTPQPYQPFNNETFTPMSPFNRPFRTPTPQPHPNYSGMGHELSYGSMSFHTQDFMEMQELLRDSPGGDVAGTSDPSPPPADQPRGRGQRTRVSRGCGTGGRYDLPGHRH